MLHCPHGGATLPGSLSCTQTTSKCRHCARQANNKCNHCVAHCQTTDDSQCSAEHLCFSFPFDLSAELSKALTTATGFYSCPDQTIDDSCCLAQLSNCAAVNDLIAVQRFQRDWLLHSVARCPDQTLDGSCCSAQMSNSAAVDDLIAVQRFQGDRLHSTARCPDQTIDDSQCSAEHLSFGYPFDLSEELSKALTTATGFYTA